MIYTYQVRFKWSNSRYFQKEPEILADLPIRIEPGNDIPILLIIKDAHIFPIIFKKAEIKIIKNNKIIQSKIFSYNADIDLNWWDDTITIDATGILGDVEINVKFFYKISDGGLMQLARFLNGIFKKDGFILENADSQNYIIGTPKSDKPIKLKILDK